MHSASLPKTSLAAKLATIGAAFVLPLGVLLFLAVSNINDQLTFSRLEGQGNAFLRPLVRLLEYLPLTKTNAGDAEEVDRAFADLQKVNALYGTALQFTTEGLGLRNRGSLAPSAVANRWSGLKGSRDADYGKKIDALLDDVSGMITHAGDTSNLILDPDLDSYYMMDLTLLVLPQTQRRLTTILEFGKDALSRKLTDADLRKFNSFAEMLSESDFTRIESDTSTSLNEDKNFYGLSPTLASQINPAFAAYKSATEPFIKMLADLSSGKEVSKDNFTQVGDAARKAAFQYWHVCSGEMEKFLRIRIADYEKRRLIMLGATAIALILASLLALYIIKDLTGSIFGMMRFTNEITAGNLSAVLDDEGSTTELNKLRSNLEAMVNVLKEKLGFSQAILNGIEMPCVVVDKDGKISFLNEQLVTFMCCSSSTESYIGKGVSEFFVSNKDISDHIYSLRQATTKAPSRDFEGKNIRNEDFYAKLDVAPVVDHNGATLGCFAQFTVLTEMKRQEAAILEAGKVIRQTADKAEVISGDVSGAAAEMSEVVERIGKGMDIQRRRTEETVSAMTEMNATTVEVAKNASHAALQAEMTMSKAREGAQRVNASVESIDRVKNQTDSLKGHIEVLGQHAVGIDKIMNVISDIADQTNLLALNAAIEAARAGEAGRGFAVVADEVRKLAEKTVEATHEVAQAISAIQTGAQDATRGMEEALETVKGATELADQSGAALREILELASSTNDQVRSIATAAEEQSATSKEIAKALEEVNHVTEETVQGMERSSTVMKRVTSQVEALDGLIKEMTA